MSSTKSISKAAAALGSVRSAAKTEAARTNGQLGGRPRSSALEQSASAVGLIVERYPDGKYWVSGVEAWRSGTWVRSEIARRSSERTED